MMSFVSDCVAYLKAVFWESWRWVFTLFDVLGVVLFFSPSLADTLITNASLVRTVGGFIFFASFFLANLGLYRGLIKKTSVVYRTHIEGAGWIDWVSDGKVAGTIGQSMRMEAIRIKLDNRVTPRMSISYQVHVQDLGWMDWQSEDEVAGTVGQYRRMEAIRIKLVDAPLGYQVFYRAYVEGKGWISWVSDGETAGTAGEERRLEAIRILIIRL